MGELITVVSFVLIRVSFRFAPLRVSCSNSCLRSLFNPSASLRLLPNRHSQIPNPKFIRGGGASKQDTGGGGIG